MTYKPFYPPTEWTYVALSTPYRKPATVHALRRPWGKTRCGVVALNVHYLRFRYVNDETVRKCRRCWAK